MAQLIVIVDKLNKRKSIPADFSDKTSIIGVVNRGFQFEGTQVQDVPNAASGNWFQDRDGSFYWGSGLTLVSPDSLPEAAPLGDQEGSVQQTSFPWFDNLKIPSIWSQYNTMGEGAIVAVLDTGYNINNNDLSPAVIGVVNLDGSTPRISNADTKSPLINDSAGHGTFCASIIGNTNSKEYKVGIAPKCGLLVAKISNDMGLDPTGLEVILNGIAWAIQSNADIISVSFGKYLYEMPKDPDYLMRMQNRFAELVKGKNILIFASCGDNLTEEVSKIDRYPASLEGCISVGATDNGQLSSITVLSDKTIIHAQGIGVEAYYRTDDPEAKSGTSMSTPIVAGVVALAVSYLKNRNNGAWDASDLKQKLFDTGDPIPGYPNKKMLNPVKFFEQL